MGFARPDERCLGLRSRGLHAGLVPLGLQRDRLHPQRPALTSLPRPGPSVTRNHQTLISST